MIKDIKVIKQLLEGHVEVELPYPFKEGVEIKYMTMKDERWRTIFFNRREVYIV